MKVTEEEKHYIARILARASGAVIVAGISKDKYIAQKQLNILNRLVKNAGLDPDMLIGGVSS